jgi:hypothetical protein
MSNKFGTFKLVNRRQFSYANFTMKKEWVKWYCDSSGTGLVTRQRTPGNVF